MANTMKSSLVLALVDRVTAPARNVQGTMARLNDRIEQNKRAVRQARGEVIGATAGLAAFGLALAGPVRSAMQLESALADVAKVADFDPAGLEEFKGELQAMARRVPLAVTELAALAAEAAAAGVATEDLARFTERAAQVGVALGMTGDQAGMAMAKLRTGLDMTVDEVFSLADAMNFLSNSQASNAEQLTSFMLATGADAKSYGFAAEEAVAIGSAMIAAGASADVAATSFRNVGRRLSAGASATARQRSAMQQLGLDVEEVSRSMQDDAAGTFIGVLERIQQMPEEMRAALRSDIFGNEARALAPLATQLHLVRESLGLVGDEGAYAGSAVDEFANRSETFEAKLRIFRSTLEQVSTEVGEALLPALTDLMELIGPLATRLAEWVDEHPDAVEWIAKITGALIGLRLAVTSAKFLMLIGQGGILMLTARGLGAVVGAAAGAAKVTAMATALGKLATSAGRLGALGGIGAILTPNRLGEGTITPEQQELWDQMGDEDKYGPHAIPGTEPGGPYHDNPQDAPGWSPMSFPRPRPIAPSGPTEASARNRGTSITGNQFHINVAGSNASAEDIARALGDELRSLTNSQFSDGAIA